MNIQWMKTFYSLDILIQQSLLIILLVIDLMACTRDIMPNEILINSWNFDYDISLRFLDQWYYETLHSQKLLIN